MPVTPLHLGVGLLGKGALPRRVSILAFAISQVLIDVEVAYYLFVDRSWPLHRWAHTFLGATAIGFASGLATWLGGSWAVARLGDRWKVPRLHECSFQAAVVGGLLGGLTHPLLDGLMHDDILPLLPFSTANPFAGLLAYPSLALALLASGVLGLSLLALRYGRKPIS